MTLVAVAAHFKIAGFNGRKILEQEMPAAPSAAELETDREEPPASPPTTSSLAETEKTEHERLRTRGELHWQVNEWLGALGGFEYVKENYEAEEDGVSLNTLIVTYLSFRVT